MRLTGTEIANATNGRWVEPAAAERLVVGSISTDTRTLRPGQLFVALKGERFDAHDHLGEAVEKGASALIVRAGFDRRGRADQSVTLRDLTTRAPVLQVADTLCALGDLAAAWRAKCPARRVAIIGSSGKTTTKEMLAAILRAAGSAHASEGNLNNLVGVPLTLFGLQPFHRWAVLELGMNLPGELGRLTRILDPDVLVVVNIGSAHVGRFDSREALLEAKGEAVRALRPDATILYNAACENSRRIVERWGAGRPLRAFSPEAEAGGSAGSFAAGAQPIDLRGYAFDLHLGGETLRVELPVFGRYNVANAVAAAAAAELLGVSANLAVDVLRRFQPTTPLRSEVREVGGVTLVIDCYNANPESMAAALRSLGETPWPNGRTYLVLGDMLELGEEAPAHHRRIGREVARLRPDGVLLFGELSALILEGWRGEADAARWFESREALAECLAERVQAGDRVFFKGSRGMELEKVVQRLETRLARAAPVAGS